ncbi:MAG: hypothetical protein AB7G20_09385 [Sulfurimonas sp.]|uniref:hypothetical protein n=1 Tax=Sulfurimonas sp. TaxID=2022749 RepID=UPI003D0A629B
MNIKKTIKYILLAAPLLFLTKCGAESTIYNANKTPEINPHPIEKMRIYGQTSFGKECKLIFNIKYAPNDSFGMRQTKWIKVPTDLKKDGLYEAIVYKDYFTQNFSTLKMIAFNPEFQCQGYSQGGRAMLNLTDKSKLTKRLLNCTKEQRMVHKKPPEYGEHLEKTITCAVSNSHSIGFEEISSSQKELEVNFTDKGLNAPYHELIK